MWICNKCGEKIDDQFDSCWKCSTPRPEVQDQNAPTPPTGQPQQWKLNFKYFRGTFATWDELFSKAAYFASEIGPERVLNISHSVDDADGVVTVWYWSSATDNL